MYNEINEIIGLVDYLVEVDREELQLGFSALASCIRDGELFIDNKERDIFFGDILEWPLSFLSIEGFEHIKSDLEDFYEILHFLDIYEEICEMGRMESLPVHFAMARNGEGDSFEEVEYGEYAPYLKQIAQSFGPISIYIGDRKNILEVFPPKLSRIQEILLRDYAGVNRGVHFSFDMEGNMVLQVVEPETLLAQLLDKGEQYLSKKNLLELLVLDTPFVTTETKGVLGLTTGDLPEEFSKEGASSSALFWECPDDLLPALQSEAHFQLVIFT